MEKALPSRYLGSAAVTVVATLLAKALSVVLNPTDAVMIYLAASVFVAARFGRGPSVLFSALSCASYNFFFVEPLYTFEMYNRSSWLTLLVMLITSMVISGQAISLRRQERLTRESTVAAENERIKNLLLSSVSHDLRTPLASITGASSSLMQDDMPEGTVKELARSIHQEAARLSRIVSNLLDITRIESGAVALNRQPYYIDELIGAALSQVPEGAHTVETRVEKDLALVYVDGLLIEQVLVNLLENAVKYAPQNSAITLTAVARGDEIIVSVADAGPGIAPGDEKRIFEKFTRRARDKSGSGLGLAICEGIIRAHQSRIWAENRPEGGARFSFTLPVAVKVSEEPPHG
ncbi:MAG: DUF4118 domain-containing protein [Alphaproteobacteria bacterium]|nr:DUF4118 domain-containing protein [Alphaproteobacteria bacterium]MDE2336734.1 DUF4118 domain-containing protein [Alphaproteobacteria bacterium]